MSTFQPFPSTLSRTIAKLLYGSHDLQMLEVLCNLSQEKRLPKLKADVGEDQMHLIHVNRSTQRQISKINRSTESAKMPRNYCPHERISRYMKSENLVGLIVAMTGRPSTGKTALAREVAKALRCSFLEYDRFHSCIPEGAGLTSEDGLAYQILWKMIDTHLDSRNHHIVIDSPLSRRVELDRLLGIAKSHDTVVILIVCVACGRDKLRGRLGVRHDDREGEETLARDLERSLTMEEEQKDDHFYDYDPSEIDVPKLTIETTSGTEREELVESVKKLILASLDEKFTIVEGDGTMMSECSRCIMEEVRLKFATFPKTFKHELHGDEFHLRYHEQAIAKGSNFSYMCNACLQHGINLYYGWGGLIFHPECVLTLPLQVTHKCHWHALKLTLLPPKDETDEYYCEVCAEERDADSWIYYCQGCEYEAHIPCVVPHFRPYTMPEAKESSEQSWVESEDDSYVYSNPSEEEEKEEDKGEQENEEGPLAGAESSKLPSY